MADLAQVIRYKLERNTLVEGSVTVDNDVNGIDFDDHVGASSQVHGLGPGDGTVVGTSAAQSLTNKTLGAGTVVDTDLAMGSNKLVNVANVVYAGDLVAPANYVIYEKTSTQSGIAIATPTPIITWDSSTPVESAGDVEGTFSVSTGRFTASADGLYEVTGHITLGASTTPPHKVVLDIEHSTGSPIVRDEFVARATAALNVYTMCTILPIDNGESVRLSLQHNDSAAQSVTSAQLQILRLGKTS